MERVESKELALKLLEFKRKQHPSNDYLGQLLVANETSIVHNYRFSPEDPRHIAAKVHRHITDRGIAGASGKYDPKTITTEDGVKYQPMTGSFCELCADGDMIPCEARFRDSRYKPGCPEVE